MTRKELTMAPWISIVTVLAFALAGAAHAQGGPPPMGPGGFGGPGPMARGMMGGGPRMGPAAIGTVQSVDADAHTISLKNRNGESCTLHVASDAKIVGQKTILVSDLKVGDRIQVRGQVSLITADSIVEGGDSMGMPPMGPPPGAMGGPGGFGPPPDAGGPGAFGPPPAGGRPGFGPMGPMGGGPNGMVVEMGTVTKLSPLTISFGGGRTLTVQVDSSTKVHKIGEMKLSEIKAGDRIMAMGRPMSDGSLRASRVAVNMPAPMGPAGRPGMMGGPGGFGPGGPGPGGPGFGPAAAFGPGGGPGPEGPPDPGFDPQQGAQPDMPPPPDAGPDGPGPDGAAPDGAPLPDPQDDSSAGLN